MRIAIIGAGGTGGLYGGLLQRDGHEVRYLARGAHLAALRERGLRIESQQFGTFSVPAAATDNPGHLGRADLVVLAVKTYDLPGGIAAARYALGPETMVLTLQNGVEAPDQAAAVLGAAHVLIGTTAVETTIAAPGVIAHLSAGHRLTVSELEGPPTPRVEGLVETLKQAGINALVAEDGRRALWQKASFLIPLADVTAATNEALGPILDLPETAALLEAAAEEVRAVAAACGHPLPKASFREAFSATSQASMARDFARGGPTELEALAGAIVRLGHQQGVPVPVPVHEVLYALLKLRESRFRAPA